MCFSAWFLESESECWRLSERKEVEICLIVKRALFCFQRGHSHSCALEALLAQQISQSCHQAVSLRCVQLQCLLMEATVILLAVRMGAKYL